MGKRTVKDVAATSAPTRPAGKPRPGPDARGKGGEPERLDWRAMLAARPVRNRAARDERQADQTVVLTLRKRKPGWLIPPLSWVIRPRYEGRFLLDRLGTRVWDLCDDQRTVEDVVDAFASAYALTFHEARVSVSEYMRNLVQHGALAIVMPTTSAGAGRSKA